MFNLFVTRVCEWMSQQPFFIVDAPWTSSRSVADFVHFPNGSAVCVHEHTGGLMAIHELAKELGASAFGGACILSRYEHLISAEATNGCFLEACKYFKASKRLPF